MVFLMPASATDPLGKITLALALAKVTEGPKGRQNTFFSIL